MAREKLSGMAVGLGTWALVTLPLWGALVAPLALAWALVVFNAYWLMRSVLLGGGAVVSFVRLRRAERTDWLAQAKGRAGFDDLHQLVLVPTYKEDEAILAETLGYLERQDFPRERVAVVLAFEARDPDAPRRAERLLRRFRASFGLCWALFLPLRPGEVAGKSSNLEWVVSYSRLLTRRRGVYS